jgi:hypothetical protein
LDSLTFGALRPDFKSFFLNVPVFKHFLKISLALDIGIRAASSKV